MNNNQSSGFRAGLFVCSALLGFWPAAANAQVAAKTSDAAAAPVAVKDEIIVLSPFKVTTEKDTGYRATNSISGSRLDTAIKDLPMPIEVITEQFLKDTGSTDLRQSLRYSAGILLHSQNDYGTPGGAYQGPGGVNNAEGATANQNQSTVKIRGFVTRTVLRDGYLRQNATDSINLSRIEVVRGPAALLYGIGNFGGIVNYLPKLPEATTHSEVGFAIGSYAAKRATIDMTGPLTKTWELNYRLTGAWEEADDYTDFRKSTHHFISPVFTFKPTKTTEVTIDYENGAAKDKGIGFQRVRSSVGPGPNNDQNEHAAFYTLKGTDPRTFRWSGPDTYLNTKSSNLRLQVDQQLMENMHLLVGYNKSSVTFNKLDVIGNLQGWVPGIVDWVSPAVVLYVENPAKTAFGMVPFVPADPINGTSNLGLGVVNGLTNATLAYRWAGQDMTNDLDQVRAELVYNFKFLEGNANRLLRMNNMLMVGHSELRQDNDITNYITAVNQRNEYNWATNFYNPLNPSPLRFGQTQPNGTKELPYLKSSGAISSSWNQATYVVYQGKVLDDRMTIVTGARRDSNSTLTNNTDFFAAAPKAVVARGDVQKQTTYQSGVSYKLTNEITVFALKSGGLEPNLGGDRDTDGKPLPATLAKSKEYGVKIDLFNGKLTGTISAFKINRTNSPIFYWWAPTSNLTTHYNAAKDIVYNVSNFSPSSVAGGSNGGNGAPEASIAQWNSGVSAGAIYQLNNTWYVNGSKATGAAYLDAVFKSTFDKGSTWPGWLYNNDSNTNNAWESIASAAGGGNEKVLGADTSSGWDSQLVFTPSRNLQFVVGYAHVSRVVDQPGKFSKSPITADRWAPWFFPNTDWGLTKVPVGTMYTNVNDTSTWQGINWGKGLPMDDTPEHQFTAWANYSFTEGSLKGLTFGLGGYHESPRLYLSGLTHGGGQQITDASGNPVNLRTMPRSNFDLMVRYSFKLAERDASLQLNVNNLLDDQKMYGLMYSAPRTMRLELDYKF